MSKNGQRYELAPAEVFGTVDKRRHRGALLLGIGTAVPPHQVSQEEACAFHERVMDACHRYRGWEEQSRHFARRVFTRSGIERRYSVLPDFQFTDPSQFTFFPKRGNLEPVPGTAQRMSVFERESVKLAEESARRALGEASVSPSQVTHLVISTCTGFFAPGPDVLLARRLGLSPAIERTILGYMGCYAGISGLRTADQILRADPGAVVLQICVELCSLHYSKDSRSDAVVANALFGDGAAAAVYVGSEWEGGCGQQALAQVAATCSHVSEDSLDHMSWRVGDHGFEMKLDVGVPEVLRRESPAFVAQLAKRAGFHRRDITNWALHPGGRRIVEVLRDTLELTDDDVSSSFEVLKDFGNMSSTTILFVLDRELRRPDRPAGPVAALAFGPGLTVEGAILERRA